MRKVLMYSLMMILLILAACGSEEEAEEADHVDHEGHDHTDELLPLEVEFIVPETAELGEEVELHAIVTYGDDAVEDADEVLFEYWLEGQEEESEKVEGEHTKNGRYVATVIFDESGVYEMYAHTTAEGLHTMPLTTITIVDAK